MNAMNLKTEVVVDETYETHATPVDLVQLLHTYMPREALRRVVVGEVILALTEHVRNTADSDALVGAATLADRVRSLRLVPAVALPPELCTLMARVGFDKSLFTYGQRDGRAVGYAEGVWLLKFVGLADAERTAAADPALQRGERAFARQA